jgi:PAS domain S-box-containing protein
VSKPIRVLIVEDSEDDARLAVRMLRTGGFDTSYRRVQDVDALHDAFTTERWDAVLSDFRLPGFNGVDALDIFRKTGLDIPFIFCSGTIGEEIAVAAMKAGASDYVMKSNMARLAPVLERELAQAAIRAEHRQAQIDLEVSRDRYMDLYDFAPVGYLTLSAEGLIEQVNLTGADLLGERREQLTGSRFSTFVRPADVEGWYQHFVQALHHSGRQRLELVLVKAGGANFHAQLDCMRVDSGSVPMVRVAVIDISDRKEAEAEVRRFEAQLREVQKMESLGTLAGGIAHDFNNILGAVLGNVTLAREELGKSHPAQVSLGEIYKASLRARNLVRQILAFSRREPQQLVTQPLHPVLEETHKLLRATLPASVHLDVVIPEQPLFVHADANQMQQVLMNLCTNAWHALGPGTNRISMGLDAVLLDEATAHRVGDLPGGRYAHLWVRDTGGGMDEATRKRIFEPFFTTKPVGQGTGLGLSVVHGIVASHHGGVTVDSELGQGSTFHLYFPLVDDTAAAAPPPGADAPAATAAAPAGEATRGQGHGEHVMYVDDDETMLVMVQRLLERGGYRVSSFLSAKAALAAVRSRPNDYDFVVTDFNMPELSGLEVARALQRIQPRLPVVLSSGYITEDLRAQAQLAGVRSLLEKQNTFQELCAMVDLILANKNPGTKA